MPCKSKHNPGTDAELEARGRAVAREGRLACLLGGIQKHNAWAYEVRPKIADDHFLVFVAYGGVPGMRGNIADAEVHVHADSLYIAARGGPALKLPFADRRAGNAFHRELAALVKRCSRAHNPPVWAADADTWRAAKRRVLGKAATPKPRHFARYKDPWALVAYWYRELGGRVR